MKKIGIVGLVVIAALSSACSKHYVVTSKFSSQDLGSEAEVVYTSSYRSAINKVKKIAVLSPDSCANKNATESKGIKSAGSVMKTNCGVEMDMLERKLAMKGYKVISWKVLARKTITQEPLSAARSLGADALLQVNSLEKAQVKVGKDARWERRFFKSNSKGELLKPAQVKETVAASLDRISNYREGRYISRQGARLGVTLNASAINVKNGESIWFYDWTLADEKNAEKKIKTLVECKSSACTPVVKRRIKERTNKYRSGSANAETSEGSVHNETEANYRDLLKEVVTDFVNKFSKEVK